MPATISAWASPSRREERVRAHRVGVTGPPVLLQPADAKGRPALVWSTRVGPQFLGIAFIFYKQY